MSHDAYDHPELIPQVSRDAEETSVIPREFGDTAGSPRESDETAVIARISDETAVIAPVRDVVEPAGELDRGVDGQDTPGLHDLLGAAPLILLISSLGVVATAFGYHFGRHGSAWGEPLYWLGQALVFGPTVLRAVLRRALTTAEAFVLVIGMAVSQYLLKWLYSPDQFRFPDELQHMAATSIINDTGRLFQPNPALPVAASFPGLAEIGSAVSEVTGLPVTTAGMIVAGVCRLFFVAALFCAVHRASRQARVALFACVFYTTSAHYLFFNAMYLYQAAALAFVMVSIWATYRLRSRASLPLSAIAVSAGAATVVTHHVTGVFLCLSLLVLGGASLLDRRARTARPFAVAALVLILAALWIAFPARPVLAYFEAPLRRVWTSISTMFSASSAPHVSTYRAPIVETAIQVVALFVVLCILVATAFALRREPRRTVFHWTLLLASASFFASSGLRLLGSQGPELAGRASTFTFLPLAVLLAWRADRWLVHRSAHRGPGQLRQRATATVSFTMLLMVSGRVGGWPPGWERLPGREVVSGFESAITPSHVQAAKWTRAWLGSGHRMGADITGWTLVASYGGQDPVTEVAPIYYTSGWSLADLQLLTDKNVQFLWVDSRMARAAPITGSLFLGDPQAGQRTTPLPMANIDKFDSIAYVRRVYDDGTIRIYDVRGMK